MITRWLETTDPLMHTDRLEFAEGAVPGGSVGIPASDETGAKLPVPAGMPLSPAQAAGLLFYRNTFFWNRSIYAKYGTGAGKDYTKAEVVHWLHTNNGLFVAPTIESTRRPLENRTWYQYSPSQTDSVLEGPPSTYLGVPTTIARVLDDGDTQLTSIGRNKLGKPTLVTDPVHRQTQFTYAPNDVDLTLVQQKTLVSGFINVASYTYNAQHEPLTYTDAAGQTTQYGYNARGQLQTITDALGNTRTLVYDDSGRLSKVLDANNVTSLTLTYDDFNRIATRADSVGYSVSYTYDVFDRVTKVAYPDGTSDQFDYTNLDLTSSTDRLRQTTTYAYDANRQLISVTDPLLHVTKYAYDEDGTLKSVTDANNNATTWDVDIERRPIAKHYAKGTTETYTYENATGRFKSKTDALQQVISYAYNLDDTLAAITYTGTGTAPQTAPVSFTYDPVFPRRTSMTDGVGTTTYGYYPIAAPPALGAGRLQFVASPVAGAAAGAVDVLSYSYDELGRVAGGTVNGAARGITFDALGRPKTVTNALDSFNYGYSDETARVTSIASRRGPKVALSYHDTTGYPGQNEHLQQMTYAAPSGSQVLAQFGYEYDATSKVKTFTETHLARRAVMNPDGGAMGTFLPRTPKGPRAPTKPHDVAWRKVQNAAAALMALSAGLLIAAMFGARRGNRRLAFAAVPLALGLMFAACSGDDNSTAPAPDAGTGTDGGDAATGGRPDAGLVLTTRVTAYSYDAAGRLLSATLGAGGVPPAPSATPQIVYAYDPASNLTTIGASGATQTPTYTNTNEIIGGNYDPNGSPKTLAGAQYAWDAANRLVWATVGGIKSELTYDGLNRLVRIVTKQGATTISDKAYTWSGSERVLEHDNAKGASPVSQQYFAQGVVAGDTPYYYATDQLGSVRQLVDASGAVSAQYDYDPYGNRAKLDGDANSDLGFTGLFHHASTGLDFALFRSYNAQQGRWLNRDPIGEAGGLNLYGYVGGNPVSNTDPSGEIWWTLAGAAAGASVDIAYQMHTKGCVSWGEVGNAALLGSGLGGLAEGLAARFAARAAVEGVGAAITRGEQVTEQVIREAMKDAPLVSQQAGGVSLPRVQLYVDKLLAGEVAPAIKIEGNIIIDGNHRYVAGRILGQEPAIQLWSGARPNAVVPWSRLPISPEPW